MYRKFALMIGVSEYADQTLTQLKTPSADVITLASALRDPQIGGFDEVIPLLNPNESTMRRAITAFYKDKKPDDLVLLYFSGHGVLDEQGSLFLAVKDTERAYLRATAISSRFITEDMDSCRSKRQILLLDCCHSGAFVRGHKGESKAVTMDTFQGNGYGRAVLTASDSTQYALEGDQIIEQAKLSLFTHYLLQGLVTGEADFDEDGQIGLDEWYDYTFIQISSQTPNQTPKKWVYNQQGELIIARSKRQIVAKQVVIAATKPVDTKYSNVFEMRRLARAAYFKKNWHLAVELLSKFAILDPMDEDIRIKLAEANRQLRFQEDYQTIRELRDEGELEAVIQALSDLERSYPEYSDIDDIKIWVQSQQRSAELEQFIAQLKTAGKEYFRPNNNDSDLEEVISHLIIDGVSRTEATQICMEEMTQDYREATKSRKQREEENYVPDVVLQMVLDGIIERVDASRLIIEIRNEMNTFLGSKAPATG